MADLNNEDGGRSRDRALGMRRNITRRDFLNGMAVGVGGVLANPWIGGLLSAQTLTASAQDRRKRGGALVAAGGRGPCRRGRSWVSEPLP